MANIFSKIFGGGNPETVSDNFAKLTDEQKTQIVEVAKSYSTPAPEPKPVESQNVSAAEDKGKEEPTTNNNVADATTDTVNNDQGNQAEVTNMEQGNQEQTPAAQPPATPELTPVPQPNPMPETPKVEYATKEQLTAYEKALADSNKLIADQSALISKQNEEMRNMRKDLDDTKNQYARFVNPSKEFDVKPDLGVAHVGGTRQSYKDIAAKTFKEGR